MQMNGQSSVTRKPARGRFLKVDCGSLASQRAAGTPALTDKEAEKNNLNIFAATRDALITPLRRKQVFAAVTTTMALVPVEGKDESNQGK